MDVVVQKYGGSSVADLPRLEGVADRIARSAGRGERVCTVVSAMGRTTDDLLALARQVTDAPPRRELDMLVSTGERIAMALLAMAIQKRGLEAISFTGSQSGIITNDRHSDAQIIEVRPVRIQDELSRGKVVIVAGFQGMSYRREITTLGRGGSDATAVALASALGASYCEICSDVDGVYTADPRRVPEAFLLEKISYEEMLELAAHGAQVLNVQAVEWARKTGVTILTSAAHREGGHSRVDTQGTGLPACGVTVAENLASLRLGGPAEELRTHLGQLGVGFRPCQGGPEAEASCVVSTAELPEWRSLRAALTRRLGSRLTYREGLSGLSVVGTGLPPAAAENALATASRAGVEVLGVETSPRRITLLVAGGQANRLTAALHRTFIESPGPPREDLPG